MQRWWVVGLVVAGCGRIGFDSRSDDGTGDDAATEPVQLVQIEAPGFVMATSASASLGQTAGHLLVAAVYWDQAPNTITLTDTAGLTWTAAPKYEISSGCGGVTGNATGAQLYYAQATISQSNTVTVTQTSGTQPLGVMVAEYSGLETTNVVEAESGQVAGAASATASVPMISTTRFTRLVAFFNDTQGQGSMIEDALLTARARDTGFPNIFEDVTVAGGTFTPAATLPNGNVDACWVGDAIAFRAR